MEKPVEFSKFYRLLNAVKEGEEARTEELKAMLEEYKTAEKSESSLEALGQIFLHIGIKALYNYIESEDIQAIGLKSKEEWEELANEKECDLPPHLANSMIKDAKDNKLSKKISNQWGTSRREIDQNIMQMARYITEGIIDALE